MAGLRPTLSQGESPGGPRRAWLIAVTLMVAIPAAGPIGVALGYVPRGPDPVLLQQYEFAQHIHHIVFVVLENHAYDSYFGAYCLVASLYCPDVANGVPANACLPLNVSNPSMGCVPPFSFTAANWTVDSRLPHNWNSSMTAWNGGAMNGFYQAEGSGFDPFGHYTSTTAPIYYDLAEQYALGDSFFSSLLDYSLPNHWHIVAGQAPAQILDHYTGLTPVQNTTVGFRSDRIYLNEANATKSVEDLLVNTSVSWKYYDYPLSSYNSSIVDTLNRTGSAFNYWNPQAAKAESYGAALSPHFVNRTEFYGDARNGTLPDLSWVMPVGVTSDHPPDNSTMAQAWLATLVNAVESSPDWNSTAMFITWDDYGGFYDHVAPPRGTAGQQLGFRVPLLVVSPYTPPGVVSDQLGYFESVLHLMEWRFNLGCITAIDCTAPLPLSYFNFFQAPRPPMLFPTNVTNASYPMPRPSGSWVLLPPYYPSSHYWLFPKGGGPDID